MTGIELDGDFSSDALFSKPLEINGNYYSREIPTLTRLGNCLSNPQFICSLAIRRTDEQRRTDRQPLCGPVRPGVRQGWAAWPRSGQPLGAPHLGFFPGLTATGIAAIGLILPNQPRPIITESRLPDVAMLATYCFH